MSFSTWNHRLLEHFFTEDRAGQAVWLAVDAQLLNDEFSDLGGVGGFLHTVTSGPDWPSQYVPRTGGPWESPWTDPGTLHGRALGLLKQWQLLRHGKYLPPRDDGPPYLLYACLFCYAWTIEGRWPANEFYARLNSVYPRARLDSSAFASLDEEGFWREIETWANEKLGGTRGKFRAVCWGGMPRIGIPRAQVVFTAGLRPRLWRLFNRLGFEPGEEAGDGEVHRLIRANRGLATQCLGEDLVEQLISSHDTGQPTEFGQHALSQLERELTAWDGTHPHEGSASRGHNPGGGNSAARDPIRLALHWEDDRWHVHGVVVPRDGYTCVTVGRGGLTWAAVFSDGPGPLGDEGGQPIPVLQFLAQAIQSTADVVLQGEYLDDDGVVEPRNFVVECRPIHVLQWDGGLLLDGKPPTSGAAYVLAHQSCHAQVDAWAAQLGTDAASPRVEQSGVPNGWKLYCIADASVINADGWRHLLGSSIRRSRPQLLRVIGGVGTTSGAGDIPRYRRDIPPWLLCLSHPTPNPPSCTGAVLEEQRDLSPRFLHRYGNAAKLYRVSPLNGTGRVTAWATLEGAEQSLTFRLAEGGDASPASRTTSRVDSLARRAGDDLEIHAEGYRVVGRQAVGPFRDFERMVLARPRVTNPQPGQPWERFFSWLRHRGRVSYADARLFAGFEGAGNAELELHALAHLGHIEIERDSRGNAAHVCPVRPLLYLLPTVPALADRPTVRMALTGTYDSQDRLWVRKFANSHRLLFETHQHPQVQPFAIVPPRCSVAVGHSIQSALAMAEVDGGVSLSVYPPALALAEFSASIEDWRATVPWQEGLGRECTHSYDPVTRRFVQLRQGGLISPGTRFSLGRFSPDWAPGLHLYQLQEFPTGNALPRAAVVRDRDWAVWLVQQSSGLATIAYCTAEKRLYVPAQLRPPPLLSRALVACSGLLPTGMSAGDVRKRTSASAATVQDGYHLCYWDIPRAVAVAVAGKVGATLATISPLAPQGEKSVRPRPGTLEAQRRGEEVRRDSVPERIADVRTRPGIHPEHRGRGFPRALH